MRVLVTGGAGYIGSHTCKALAAAGHSPTVFDNLSTGHAEHVRWGRLIKGDLRDPRAISRAVAQVKPHAVIHFAASSQVGESVVKPLDYYQNNVGATLNLLRAMQQSQTSAIIFSSTCAVYAPPTAGTISETTPFGPINPYGRSKLMIEHAIRDVCLAHGLSAVALRYFNAAGADIDGELGEDHEPETHLIPLAIEAALKLRPPMKIFGDDYPMPDGTCVRDYVHVGDIAAAHVAALDAFQPGQMRAFNLGAGVGRSVLEVMRVVGDVCGVSPPASMAPRRDGDHPALVADPTLAQEALGWRATLQSLESIVRTAARWTERKHGLQTPARAKLRDAA